MRKRKGFSLAELLIGIAGLGFIAMLSFATAKPQDPLEIEREEKAQFEEAFAKQISTVTVEGHEYFRCTTTHGYFVLSHKGNCKGCASLTAEAP